METPQSAKGVLKIFAPPKKTFIEIDKDKLDCWLHPLTGREKLLVEAVAQETLRASVEQKLSEDFITYAMGRAEICQRLFFSLRKTGELNAERFFKFEEEVAYISSDQTLRLAKEYKTEFVCSEEELKNCYRERLGMDSATLSTSPSGSVSK